MKLYSFLFPRHNFSQGVSLLLLGMRILFGGLLLTHGMAKFANYTMLAETFPDPLGIGSQWSVSLAIFAEMICSSAFILGLLYRLSTIPMIITMFTAFLFTHHGSLAEGELAFIYLAIFIFMYIAGPGRYSIDALIASRLNVPHQAQDRQRNRP